jgi:integrase
VGRVLARLIEQKLQFGTAEFHVADLSFQLKRPDAVCDSAAELAQVRCLMLLAGVPIDQVSLLLGHSSVRITERNYSPFVKARQIQLQESVRAAWKPNLLSTVKRPLSIRRATNNMFS